MTGYVARRVLWAVVELWAVITVTFLLAYLLPGNPARAIAGPHASLATIRMIDHELGLDRPLYVQYGIYLLRALHGNLGTSIALGTPVLGTIWARFSATVELAVAGLVFELLLGVPLGILAAVKAGGLSDRLSALFVLMGLSAPPFWLAIILIFLFGFRLHLLPIGGYGSPVARYVLLPGLTLGLGGAAYYARLLRARILAVMRQDFVRTARAKGLSPVRTLFRHVLPNVYPTLITQIGLDIGYFMSGVVVVEAVFGWPGIGWQAWEAIQNLDIPLILGTVLFGAFWIVVANLVVDVLYGLVDPRVHVGGG